jgi:hypothetical protein
VLASQSALFVRHRPHARKTSSFVLTSPLSSHSSAMNSFSRFTYIIPFLYLPSRRQRRCQSLDHFPQAGDFFGEVIQFQFHADHPFLVITY